jgi:predicted nucleic acid-binding protein
VTIDENTLLFFDSSCLVAAAGSHSGGSGFLLLLCARGYLKAAVSQPVLLEAQKNIQLKLGEESIRRFYNLLAVVPFSLASLPDKAEIARLELLTNKKDVHVLAAALQAQARFLLTLDRRLALEVNQARLGVEGLSPGEFIKNVLPNHVNYPATRE